jgi:hypothetical protein
LRGTEYPDVRVWVFRDCVLTTVSPWGARDWRGAKRPRAKRGAKAPESPVFFAKQKKCAYIFTPPLSSSGRLFFLPGVCILNGMEYVESLDQLEEKIHEQNAAVFVFFYRESHRLDLKFVRPILRLGKKYPGIKGFLVDLDVHPTAASQHIAYTPPAVALYYNGHLVFMKNEPLVIPEIDVQLKKIYQIL